MVQPKEKFQTLTFLIFLASLLILRLFWLIISPLPLYGDEAQYWIWSKSLDFGYYSKPPMVAWFIAASTRLFGDSEAAIRLFSPLLHTGVALIIYQIAQVLFRDKTLAIWSAVGYLTIPAVFFSSGLMSTDPILMFFWALSLLVFIKAVEKDKLWQWLLLGITTGLGLLTKYNMVIFAISILLYDWRLIKNPKLWIGGGVAFLVWLPNLLWNYHHYFVSFVHTSDLALGDKNWFSVINFLKFFTAQFGVFGPILLVSLLLQLSTKKPTANIKILTAFTLPFLVMIMLLSFFSRAHANWAAPAYVAGTILATYYLYKHSYKVLNLSFMMHLVLGISALVVIYIIEVTDCNKAYDPLKRLRGYKEIAVQLKHLNPPYIILSDDRMTLSLLTYYSGIEVYKWNAAHRIKDHFDLRDMNLNFKNKDLLLVTNYYTKAMLENFAVTVEDFGILQSSGRSYRLILLKKFKGYS